MTQPIELVSLVQELDRRFAGKIAGIGKDAGDQRKNFLSKALAAFFLVAEAGATEADAIAASIDGGQDHGIDSVYLSPTNVIWLVQSKYIEAGVGEPPLSECNSFVAGVKAFLNHRFNEFNAALNQRVPQIKAAMDQGGVIVRFALVYTGGPLHEDRLLEFSNLERLFNKERPDYLSFLRRGLIGVHQALIDLQAPMPVDDEEVVLHHYGFGPPPLRAVYGRLSAKRLAELSARHGDQLVARNIRRFRGATAVNDGINQTLREGASNLFYFNNGVTFLCDSLDQIGQRDETCGEGRFKFRNLSIVNGAQTAGTIAREPPAFYDAHPAEVLATFICLDNAEEAFGAQVTQYRNFQNAVQAQDFSALDEDQCRLKATLALAGVTYIYKPGKGDPPPAERIFTLEEASKALACRITGNGWTDLVTAPLANPNLLFDRTPGPPDGKGGNFPSICRRLFPDGLSATELWRAVQVARQVLNAIPNLGTDPSHQPILQNSVWLCLHLAFLRTKLHEGNEFWLSNDELGVLSRWIELIGNTVLQAVENGTWDKEKIDLFADPVDCASLRAKVLATLPGNI